MLTRPLALLLLATACATPAAPEPDPVAEPDPAPDPVRYLDPAPVAPTPASWPDALPDAWPAPTRSADATPPPSSWSAVRLSPNAELRQYLQRTKLDHLRLDPAVPLSESLEYLSALTDVTIVLWPDARDEADDLALDVDLQRPIALASALDLIAELSDGTLAWTVRHGVVVVTTPDNARPEPRTVIWNVADLLHAPRDFAAPEIDVSPSGHRPEWPELEERTPVMTEDALIALVQSLAPDAEVTIRDGKLIVRH